MQQRNVLSFAWRAVTPAASVTSTVWSPELVDLLDGYLTAAREHLSAGRIEEAVNTWEAALHDVPGIPAPRRESIRRLIRDTVYVCVRRALLAPAPDVQSAMEWLQRVMRTSNYSYDTEYRDILHTCGLLLHVAGRPREALDYYRLASMGDEPESGLPTPDAPTSAQLYGRILARLQIASVGGTTGGTDALIGDMATPMTTPTVTLMDTSTTSRPPKTTGTARPGRDHPLCPAAWRRLHAMDLLLHGDVVQALTAFPPPDTPALPQSWALEGALLAALCAHWRTSLHYYRRALGTRGISGLAAAGLHRFVFLAVALQCADQADMSDIEELVMAERLPLRPPRGMFANLAVYRAWVNAVRRWQYRLWVRQALQELPDGDDRRLRTSLRAMMQLQPHSSSARWLRVWLAATAAPSGATMHRMQPLRDSAAPDGSPRHLLRLAVLAAERFGGPESVIVRLNRLLEHFPDDSWGLSRWREWMLKLAEEAIADGRFKQALFQYASLLLYLPDDVDGWKGCVRVLELLGDDERAEDCRRQVKQAGRLSRKRSGRGTPASGQQQIELDILRELLEEPLQASAAVPDFPFSDVTLRRAVWASLRSSDVYLRVLLERWAAGPTNFPNVG